MNTKYLVSSQGDIYSEYSRKTLSQKTTRNKYKAVSMTIENGERKTLYVHRLVMITHNPIENYQNMQVNHKDGDKSNNDLSNLEWMTNYENRRHAVENNLHTNGSKNLNKHSEADIVKALDMMKNFKISNNQISEDTGISLGMLSNLRYGGSWRHIIDDECLEEIRRVQEERESYFNNFRELELNELRRLISEGYNMKQISTMMGIKYDRVRYLKRKYL